MRLVPLALTFAIAGSALAQGTSPLEGKDSSQGVFVRDSATVLEKFTLAERMERLRDWDNAADVYQELVLGFNDRVVPSRTDADNNIIQYRSVVPAIQERIARWPAEGLAVFRELFGDDAQRLLGEAMEETDPAERRRLLGRIFNEYFVTRAALDAARLLIDESFRAGDFASAAALADRILETYPGLGDAQPDFAFRSGLTHHLLGQTARAADRLNDLPPDAIGMLGGEPVNYRDALSAALLDGPPVARGNEIANWPLAFGDTDRHVIPGEPNPAQLQRSFRVSLTDSRPRNVQVGSVRRYRKEAEPFEARGDFTGILPVIENGEIFFHDNARLYALSMVSGTALPAWEPTHPGGVYAIEAWSKPRGLVNTTAVSESSVIAVMGKADVFAQQLTGQDGFAEQLVCLDRGDGSIRWTMAPRRLSFESGGEKVTVVGGRFSGSPIVSNGRIYIKLTGSANANAGQFEECYVLCIDEQSGEIRWAGFVASNASQAMLNRRNNNSQRGLSESHPALDGDRLYVSNDAGVIACLDAYDGTVRWLNLYERDLPEAVNNRFNRRRPAPRTPDEFTPATSNPLIVTQGKLFALPNDGKEALVYDALDGSEVLSVDLEAHGDLNQLIGVAGEQLILGNVRRIDAIAWQEYEPDLDPLDNVFWNFEFPGETVDFIGRPVIAGDHLYFCTTDRVRRVRLSNGKREPILPLDGEFAEDQGPGNLLVLSNTLVIATANEVDVYADPVTIQRELERLVRESPNDVIPRLRFAESAAASGDAATAVGHLRDAVEIIGRLDDDGTARTRTFATIMGLANRDVPGFDKDELFGLAEGIAASPQQQVRLRLTRIDAATDPGDKVGLYQELLIDDTLRSIDVNVAGDTVAASELARRRIDALIEAHGRAVYAPVETDAVAAATPLLNDPDGDPRELLDLARQYPNAQVTTDLFAVASDRLEESGNVLLARRALRASLARVTDNADRAALLERLARTMGTDPQFLQLAAAHLAEAARLEPGSELLAAIDLPNGEALGIMSRANAADRLRELATLSANALLPNLDLPPITINGVAPDPFPRRDVIDDVRLLVSQLDGGERTDRFVAWGGKSRLISAQGRVIAELDFQARPAASAWFGGVLVLISRDHVAGFDGTTGARLWQFAPLLPDDQQAVAAEPRADELPEDEQPLVIRLNDGQVNPQQAREFAALRDRAQANAGPIDRGGSIRLAAIAPDRLAVASELGETVLIDPTDGAVIWRRGVDAGQAVRMLAGPDHLALLIRQPNGQQRLLVRSLFDGDPVLEQQGGNEQLVNFNLSDDGLLLLLTPQRLRAFDLASVDGPVPTALWETEFRDRLGEAPFGQSFEPDNLLISAGKALVLGDANTETQGVYVFDLASGDLMTYPGSDTPVALSPRAGAAKVRLIASGSRVITIGLSTLVTYDIAEAGREWERFAGSPFMPTIRDVLLTPDTAVVIDEPNARVQGRSRRPRNLMLTTVTRMSDDGSDGGLVLHERSIAEETGIEPGQWRLVDGGIVYLTGEGKLVLLRTPE
ncbi:MAG: PQQ-binding-like beta-propeller repeat protein [Planctomycetota bacterium]